MVNKDDVKSSINENKIKEEKPELDDTAFRVKIENLMREWRAEHEELCKEGRYAVPCGAAKKEYENNKEERLRRKKSGSGVFFALGVVLVIVVVLGGCITVFRMWFELPPDYPAIGTIILVSSETKVKHIEVSPADSYNKEGYFNFSNISVKVYDKSFNHVRGALVTMKGCGIDVQGETKEQGTCVFSEVLHCYLPVGTERGNLTITAYKSGLGDGRINVPVLRGEAGMIVLEEK